MVAEIVWLGLACLLAPVFAQYAGMRKKAEKGFNWIMMAGLLFLLAGAFDAATVSFWTASGLTDVASGGVWLFEIIGWIFILVGVLMAVYEYFK
ncbi:MAG TPA: hypothetical protein ENG34_00045 [Candidatus Aenigmarchaeota archaeon]|nr:hypothetical protein [Candidatus Aenigmarchaeota archaeon]